MPADCSPRDPRLKTGSLPKPALPLLLLLLLTLAGPVRGDTVQERFAPPPGTQRLPASPGSFAAWLRDRPLVPGRGVVHLHTGEPKPDQASHAGVLALECGERNLQQCADAVLRLRAEYLFEAGRRGEIAFHFTSGHLFRWSDWAAGLRPRVEGSEVSFHPAAPPDSGRSSFRRYLDVLFTYAGTISLRRETLPLAPDSLRPGDLLVEAGSPGHAVLVVDVAVDEAGDRFALLAQSFMPAQQIHLLLNPAGPQGSPWYRVEAGSPVQTPHWRFSSSDLRRFPGRR